MLEKSQVQCDAGEIPYDGTNAATADCCMNLNDAGCVFALIDAGRIPLANVQFKNALGVAILTSNIFGPNGWAIYEDPTTGIIFSSSGSGSISPVSGQPTAVANTDCASRKQIKWVSDENGNVHTNRQLQIT